MDESSVIFEATFKERYYTIHDPTIDIGVVLNISAQSLHKKYFLLNTDSEHRLYSHYTMNALTILSPHYTLTILSLYTDRTLTIHQLSLYIDYAAESLYESWRLIFFHFPASLQTSLFSEQCSQAVRITQSQRPHITQISTCTSYMFVCVKHIVYNVYVTFHPKSDLKQKLFRTLFVLVDTLNCSRTSLH